MIQFIITYFNDILIAMTSIISGASVLTALTPTKKDDSIINKVKGVLDILAFNIGNAKTAKA